MNDFPNGDGIINEDIYRLIINFGIGLGRAIYLVDQTNLLLFINAHRNREPCAFMNIDMEIIGMDTEIIFMYTCYSLGHFEVPFMQELGVYVN